METKPTEFIRGSTFSAVVAIPQETPADFFVGWPLKSQIRRRKNGEDYGLIQELEVNWVNDDTETRQLLLYCKDTSKWPLGLAEVDVRFKSPDGEIVQSSHVPFKIVRGITQ